MIFFPAIDLKNGECVRLLHGDMNQVTVFNDSPADQARAFVAQGCEWLHVVDLDGAFAGRPTNADAVKAIIEAAGDVPIQLGGGIRNLDTIGFWLEQGVRRVILGTVAVSDPGLVFDACREFPGRVAVGVDAKDGMVAVEGWAEVSDMSAVDLATRFETAGVSAIIHTDIGRDGEMKGANAEASLEIALAVSIPVIISGGVSSLDDLEQIMEKCGTRIAGVISGRAVYEGKVPIGEAIEILRQSGHHETDL